jgi:hypothetical protein
MGQKKYYAVKVGIGALNGVGLMILLETQYVWIVVVFVL